MRSLVGMLDAKHIKSFSLFEHDTLVGAKSKIAIVGTWNSDGIAEVGRLTTRF